MTAASRRSMRYTDRRGARQRLTFAQAAYLGAAIRGFDRGWGGLSSTQTVRLLEHRGLVLLDRRYSGGGGGPSWRVVALTRLGQQILDRWNGVESSEVINPKHDRPAEAEGEIVERSVRIEGLFTLAMWQDLERALGLPPRRLGRFKEWAAGLPKYLSDEYDLDAAIRWARREGLTYVEERHTRYAPAGTG